MSTLDALFKPSGYGYETATCGICSLYASPTGWICRIGLSQWNGQAHDILSARKLALKCMGDQLREPATLLMKLKKAGEI
jgi:hypothetical protein